MMEITTGSMYVILKKWKGDLVQQFGIYATPTMFLLDKSLTIQAKPITYNELTNELFKRNVLE